MHFTDNAITQEASRHDKGRDRLRIAPMRSVEFEHGAFSVDAALVAEGLGIEPELVQSRMRDGSITSPCERGFGNDSGRYRLTFFHGMQRFYLVVDSTGHVIEKSTVELGTSRRTASKRKSRR